MRLASVVADGRPHAARLDGDDYVLLPYADLGELLAHDDWRERAALGEDRMAASAVSLRPVVPNPPKILCQGRNYAAHVAEMGHDLPEAPVLFSKFTASLAAPDADIAMPRPSHQLDWEAELTVVIGKAGRNIAREDALGHVAGYTIANDYSVRDFQNRTKQWLAGKAWDGLTPVGPHLVTDDELPPGADGLDVIFEVDGVEKQHGNTSQFIFDVAALIADISVFTRLEPGDLILTGTPAGVGNGRDPKEFLTPGQVAVTRIDRLGELRNTVID